MKLWIWCTTCRRIASMSNEALYPLFATFHNQQLTCLARTRHPLRTQLLALPQWSSSALQKRHPLNHCRTTVPIHQRHCSASREGETHQFAPGMLLLMSVERIPQWLLLAARKEKRRLRVQGRTKGVWWPVTCQPLLVISSTCTCVITSEGGEVSNKALYVINVHGAVGMSPAIGNL